MTLWNDLVLLYKKADLGQIFSALNIAEIDKSSYDALKIASLSQWILESGRGTSDLSTLHYNFGGLKWRAEMLSFADFSAEKISYSAHDGTDFYCRFLSLEAFTAGYWKFISRSPYKGWEKHITSPEDYINYIGNIYAPNQNYPEKVQEYFEEARSLLEITNQSRSIKDDAHGAGNDLVFKPKIKDFIKSPNFNSRRGIDIDTVVVHYTTDTLRSAINTFKNPATEVSAHYVIGKSGDIFQMVEDLDRAWHAGSINSRSIGIEHEASPGDRITPRQEKSSIQLIRWLMAEYDIPKERIIAHKEVNSTSCPGDLFGDKRDSKDLTNFKAWVDKNFSQEIIENIDSVAPDETEEIYIIQPGDTLSQVAGRHGMNLDQLLALNPDIKEPNKISPGQKIIVFSSIVSENTNSSRSRPLALPIMISEKTLNSSTYQIFKHPLLGDITITGGYMEEHHAHSVKSAMKVIFLDGIIQKLSGGVRRNIGIDYSVAPTKVKAWYGGKITKRGVERGYGRRIHMLLDVLFEYQGKKYQIYQAFAHLKKFLVSRNQDVDQGEVIGIMGGSSTQRGTLEVVDGAYPLHVDLSTYFIMDGARVEIHPQLLDRQLGVTSQSGQYCTLKGVSS
ncbi:MAG: LysM peptidoglycan-binding domain-containing protein [Spirulina sp. SIO3F2]|nr:LysM peptidoglycan-binding domain-containing protein [Spirulina sp. SIO3F2]